MVSDNTNGSATESNAMDMSQNWGSNIDIMSDRL